MHINSIKLKNFRVFEDIEITLNPNLNVIIGINGAGKTAFLDAIAAALVPYMSTMLEINNSFFSQVYLKDTDICYGKELCKIDISVKTENFYLEFRTEKSTFAKSVTFKPDKLKDFYNDFLKKHTENKEESLPICVYYPTFGRKVKNQTKIKVFPFTQISALDNALFAGKESYSDFEEWFEEEESLEDKIRLEVSTEYRNPKLQAIRNSISSFLNNFETLKDRFSNLRIKKYRLLTYLFSKLTITKNGADFELDQLSSGEKSIVMLVTDIARRLTLANPGLENPLLGSGIILIDEIDLHLHPQWQRDVVPALTATFPNCQFIVTTHSPQVISKIQRDNIFVIEDNKIITDLPNTYGKDTNTLLAEIFNTPERPQDVQNLIDTCYRLLEDENYEMAKAELRKLSKILGETDSEVLRAKTILMKNEL